MKALTNSTQLVQPSENSFSKASAAMAQAQSGFHQSVESLQQVQICTSIGFHPTQFKDKGNRDIFKPFTDGKFKDF